MIEQGTQGRHVEVLTALRVAAALVAVLSSGCVTKVYHAELPASKPLAAELPTPELAEFVRQKELLNAKAMDEAAQAGEGGGSYDDVLAVWQRYFQSMARLVSGSGPADAQRHRIAEVVADRVVRLDTLLELGYAGFAGPPVKSQSEAVEIASRKWVRVDLAGKIIAGPDRLDDLLREPLPEDNMLRAERDLGIDRNKIGSIEIVATGNEECLAEVGWSPIEEGVTNNWRAVTPTSGPLVLDLASSHGLTALEDINYIYLRHQGCANLEVESLRVLLRAQRFSEEPFGVAQVPLGHELRRAVHQTIGSELVFRVRVPEDHPTLYTAMGSLPESRAVAFQIELEDGDVRTPLLKKNVPKTNRWNSVEIDLSPWAGREIGLRFRVDTGWVRGGRVGFWANPVVRARNLPLPDVVWYLIDCLRADHMGLYGYSQPTTPNLDAFFGQGAVFERAYTNGNNTRSATATVFTGLTPAAAGTDEAWGRVGDVHLTVPEVLREMGYRTIGIVSNSNGGGPAGLDQGYSELLEFAWFLDQQGRDWRDTRLPDGKPRFTQEVMDPFAEQMGATPGVPTFVYVHTLDLHDPYNPPERYLEYFPAQGYPREWGRVSLDDAGVELTRAYDAELRYSDDLFRQFVDIFEKTLDWDKAIVWLMADHGEYLGEDEMWHHDPWFPPEDPVLRIPLAVVQRGQIPPQRLWEPAQLLDVGDTTLGLLDQPEGVLPWSLGRDLAPLFQGEWWRARRPIMSENRATEGKRIEAFYLDPYTFRRTHLGEWVTRSPGSEGKPAPSDYYDVLEAYYGLSQSFDAHALGQGQADISPAEIDQLRSLGYIE